MSSSPELAARPRLLIPVTIHFAVRYLVRTGLVRLLQHHCQPVLALSWDDPELAAELRPEGIEVVRLPEGQISPSVHAVLADLEAAFARRLHSPTTRIDRTRRHVDRRTGVRFRRWLTWRRTWLRSLRPGAEQAARSELESLLPAGTNVVEVETFLEDLRIDAVLSVTPFVVQEWVLLWACRRKGLPRIASILSFDNVTARPPIPITFDRYLVWNRHNAGELERAYPDIGPEMVGVVGPAQFDFYSNPAYVMDPSAWRRRLGLADGAPTILFGAGPPAISPHEDQYLEDLLAAITAGDLPSDLHIVLRRHPVDRPERWERFQGHPAVHMDDPGALSDGDLRPGQVDYPPDQIVDLCSSLAHTDVHVNVSSTMTLDGAYFDKPQIGPTYDRRGDRRHRRCAAELYEREHFEPIIASGGLELARSPEELIGQVRSALANPARLQAERRAMLETMCTYTDGMATQRVAAEVTAYLQARAHTPP